jgi:hypothetical protein
MAEVLAAFRPGTNSWLTSILGGRRVEKILFAATKADHTLSLVNSAHPSAQDSSVSASPINKHAPRTTARLTFAGSASCVNVEQFGR